MIIAALAQLVEHHHGKVGVDGSNPSGGLSKHAVSLENRRIQFFYRFIDLHLNTTVIIKQNKKSPEKIGV